MRGKAQFFDSCFGFFKDHPRLCGEKSCRPLFLMLKIGSPPPMRGKVEGNAAINACKRITPAYAGKSANLFQQLGR